MGAYLNDSVDYVGGNAVVNGQLVSTSDLNFRTYYKAQASIVIPKITRVWLTQTQLV